MLSFDLLHRKGQKIPAASSHTSCASCTSCTSGITEISGIYPTLGAIPAPHHPLTPHTTHTHTTHNTHHTTPHHTHFFRKRAACWVAPPSHPGPPQRSCHQTTFCRRPNTPTNHQWCYSNQSRTLAIELFYPFSFYNSYTDYGVRDPKILSAHGRWHYSVYS